VASLTESRVPDSFSVAIDYPAAIISDSSFYPESVEDGVEDTKAKIEAYVAACGEGSRIALLGYSQGGNVVTDTLAGGLDKPDPIDVMYKPYSSFFPISITDPRLTLSAVTAAAVFGNPSFSPGQSYSAGNATVRVVPFPWLIARCLRAIVAVVFESYPAEVTDRGECYIVSWRGGVAVSALPDVAVFDQSM